MAVEDAAHLVGDRLLHVAAGRLRELLAAYERQRDLILLGAYQRGSDPVTDEAIARMGRINAFLGQRTDEAAPFEETVTRLRALVT